MKSKATDNVIKFIGSSASISITNFMLLAAVYYNFGIEFFSQLSFMFLLANFSFGVLNGSVLTTLQILSERSSYPGRHFIEHVQIFYILSLVFFLISFVTFTILARDIYEGILFALCLVFLSARWFARASFLISKKIGNVYSLDLNMSLATIFSVVLSFLTDKSKFIIFFTAITFLQLLLTLNLKKYFFLRFSRRGFSFFIKEFRNNGKFSFLGVVCTEVSNNFFLYFTAFVYGATNFAVLSMCMMLYRPIQIVSSSVAASERPNIKVFHETNSMQQRMKYLNSIMLIALISNLLGIVTFLMINHHYEIVPELNTVEVYFVVAFLLVIYFVKGIRVFPSLVLQFAQEYRFLFKITLISAAFTVVLTIANAYIFELNYIYSLVPVLLGELILVLGIMNKRIFLNG